MPAIGIQLRSVAVYESASDDAGCGLQRNHATAEAERCGEFA